MAALLALAALLAWWVLAVPGGDAGPPGPVITQAGFARSAEGPFETVALPDSWSRRGLPRPGHGVYRMQFTLPAVPEELWALQADRLGSRHELRLNGALVAETRTASGQARPRAAPALVTLPPALLRAGRNELELSVDAGLRAGLTPVSVGPADELALVQRRTLLWDEVLPRWLNIAAAGVCVPMLLLWIWRRGEAAFGLCGVLGLLTSLRNTAYFETSATLPSAWSNLLFLVAQAGSVALLGLFAVALAGARLTGWRRLFVVVPATVASAALLVLLLEGEASLDVVRAFGFPPLMLLVPPAVWLIGRRAWQQRRADFIVLCAALAVVLGAGVHDYLYQLGRTAVTDRWWLPYTIPLVVFAVAALLVQRLVAALAATEEANRTLEARVQERTVALQAAHDAKARLLAAASHDLRQPLAATGLLLSLLQEQAADEAQRGAVRRAGEALGSAQALLAGLLDLSRLDPAAGGAARVQDFALQTVLDAIAAHARPLARERGLQLRVRRTALRLHSDPLLVEQALRNLLANALRYTSRGGVLVAARRRGGRIALEVWDTGRGIPPASQQAVFEAFVRLQPGADDEGVGLGLSIVARCAALLEAELGLRSEPGRGSVFTLRLPASADAFARGG